MSNGPLLRPDPPADWRRWVVYQIYPRSFADSDADGVGDLRGVLGRLDYLERLGVDVVWLSPVYRSPMDDNGYDISDYTGHRPAVRHAGRPGRADRRTARPRHAADDGPGGQPHLGRASVVLESRSSRDNPKRDWYWWRDPRPGATPGRRARSRPTGSRTSPGRPGPGTSATGQYYLHIFSAKQPDLNWENPEVRQAVYAMMRWWLDRGVDGFRMDVINMISKDTSLPDTSPGPARSTGPVISTSPSAPATTSSCRRCTARSSPPARAGCSRWGRCPTSPSSRRPCSPRPDRRELDMVFQFEHVRLDQGAHRVRPAPADAA